MKNIFLMAVSLLLCVSCSNYAKTITVTNTLDFDRKGEIVEVPTSDLKANFASKTYVLKNDRGEEVGYQLINNGSTLIFQVDVPAASFAVYTLSAGKPAPVDPKTAAFFVPDRKDDFAFENDLAAYRMYGPALAAENPSNGVDLWMKCTDKPIMRKFYDNDLYHGKSYHVDHGEGLDCYKVAHTLGAGGIAPFIDGILYVGNHYSTYEILEQGALRSVFTLVYDLVEAGNNTYKQTLTITVDAGSPLNKAVVRYEGAENSIQLATGIFLHNIKAVNGIVYGSDDHNMIAYAEDATAEVGGLRAGRTYVGVVTPEKSVMWMDVLSATPHLARISDYQIGDEFVYYFGGAWNKWGFPTDNDWVTAMENFSKKIKNPLEITVE